MRLRHTLTHVLQLPPFISQWETRAGNTPWTIDATPSVTVGALDESIIETGFNIAPGLYEINYDVTLSDTGILELTFDKTNHSVTVGSGDTGSLSAGNSTGTFYINVTDYGDGAQIGFADQSSNSNTITINSLRFVNAGHEISEPDGWKGATIKLERDPSFFSLTEYYDGEANGGFIFYGQNDDVDGGINYLREVETTYGFDEVVEFSSELDIDDTGVYQELFSGLVDLSLSEEMDNNQMLAPVISNDFWTRFISRMDTPVNLSDNIDLDGNEVTPLVPVTITLTDQKIRARYEGYQEQSVTVLYDIPDNQYGIIDFAQEKISEIEEKHTLYRVENPALPASLFTVEYGGDYNFDIEIRTSTAVLFGSGTDSNLQVRLQIDDDAPIVLTQTGESFGLEAWTNHNYTGTLTLKPQSLIRLYFYNNNATGSSYQFIWYANVLQESHLIIVADTEYLATEAQGYLIHDLIHGALVRMGLGTNPFHSEFLGSTLTTAKQYDEDGCGWTYVILKGLQIRQYTLTEKPFFISFKEIWQGINPILNLGLGYELIDSAQVLRIEEKGHFLDESVSIYFSNVREIRSSYDQEYIFNKIKTGYKEWQSEDISGIDDPQTKHVRATRLKAGKEIDLESGFIAAGLATEVTRRTFKKKSEDYKFDNKNFIIALNPTALSTNKYQPELDENFDSVTNVINSDTRYNLILTPLRNFLRWIPFLNGCLQMYQTSKYKFVSGEGNYDMVSDYSCASGNFCQSKSCDPRSEKMDVAVNDDDFDPGTGQEYYFLPKVYDITLPMDWEEFEMIRNNPKKSIGISQTDEDHTAFIIKLLDYNFIKGEAQIQAWTRNRDFAIQVIDQQIESQC